MQFASICKTNFKKSCRARKRNINVCERDIDQLPPVHTPTGDLT